MERITCFTMLLFLFMQIKVLGANVPDPVAFFPLNVTYGTREIKDRSFQGVPHGVNLAPGIHGQDGGSYEFAGTANSYIQFPNSHGKTLDVRFSITMLCWVYNEGVDGPLFVYEKDRWRMGVHLMIFRGKLYARFSTPTYSTTNYFFMATSPLDVGWRLVGASYDNNTGNGNLWIDGVMYEQKQVGAGGLLGTQDNVRMGASVDDSAGYLKGKITQMRLFDVALRQEQVQEIKALYDKPSWKDLGCWKENRAKPVLPYLLVNLRSEMHMNPCDINKAINLCYKAAKDAGKKYFTLRVYGDCVATDDDSAYMKYGRSDACMFGSLGNKNNIYVYKGEW